MSASPFSYYRGAAIVMAEDLAGTPTTGWLVQACGDAHVDNFGGFGTDQGSLVFDVNDFDETHPAPGNGTSSAWRRVPSSRPGRSVQGRRCNATAATAGVAGYREAMQVLADMDVMDRWTSSSPALALMKSRRRLEAASETRSPRKRSRGRARARFPS